MKLPDWAKEFRPTQTAAIQDCIEQFETNQVVFLDAPTGTGKTLIADCVRQVVSPRAIYLCSSISLQHQFQRDFPNAAILKGRSNYPTLDYPNRFTPGSPQVSLSCADCNKRKDDRGYKCNWCSDVKSCPYEKAKAGALRSELVCANSYYFLYEANYVGTLSKRGLVIVDEVDTLESVLLSFIQVEITENRMKEFKLPYPDKKTVMSTWIEWANECKEVVGTLVRNRSEFIAEDLATIKRNRRLDNLVGDLGRLLDPNYGLSSGNWVYDGYRDNHVVFKPITVSPYAQDYLWKHGERWLLMSATVISTVEMAMSLGLMK